MSLAHALPSVRPDQAGTDQRQLARAEQRAALEAQAAALSAKMAESHLAVFRAEAKNRRASTYPGSVCGRSRIEACITLLRAATGRDGDAAHV